MAIPLLIILVIAAIALAAVALVKSNKTSKATKGDAGPAGKDGAQGPSGAQGPAGWKGRGTGNLTTQIFSVYLSTNFNITASNTNSCVVPFDTILYGNPSSYDKTNDNFWYIFPVSGYYEVSYKLACSIPNVGSSQLAAYIVLDINNTANVVDYSTIGAFGANTNLTVLGGSRAFKADPSISVNIQIFSETGGYVQGIDWEKNYNSYMQVLFLGPA